GGAGGVGRDGDRAGAVAGRDAGGDPVAGLDRDHRRVPQRGGVAAVADLLEAEPLAGGGGERDADQAARLGRHEVDRGGVGELGGDQEVAVPPALGVVAQENHAAGGELVARERHGV